MMPGFMLDRSPKRGREAPSALAVENLSYAFGKRKALAGVSFAIRPGEFVVLLGPNGAGKTTLFALIARLYESRQGTIAIHGFDLQRSPGEALKRLGIVFQEPSLDFDLTVDQNLRYHASLHGMSGSHAAARIETELARFALLERRHDKARSLSGGLRRRAEIARALLHDPSLLLLDEPTVGLDVASRKHLLERVHGLCRERDIAVLWATHLIDEAENEARIILLHKGDTRAAGSAADIVAAAGAASLREAFLGLTEARP
jgi:ABC-2 type transport system ATP-binding protein